MSKRKSKEQKRYEEFLDITDHVAHVAAKMSQLVHLGNYDKKMANKVTGTAARLSAFYLSKKK